MESLLPTGLGHVTALYEPQSTHLYGRPRKRAVHQQGWLREEEPGLGCWTQPERIGEALGGQVLSQTRAPTLTARER